MVIKYRIRLHNNRVIGPFNEGEVLELFKKGHISGDEYCQKFPIGEWRKIAAFENLYNKIQEIAQGMVEPEQNHAPFCEYMPEKVLEEKRKANEAIEKRVREEADEKKKLNNDLKRETTNSALETHKEFKFDKEVKIDIDYKALAKKYKSEEKNNEEEEDNKTRVVNLKHKKPIDIEKTVVVNLPKIEKKIEPDSVPVVENQQEKNIPKKIEPQISTDEKTQFFDIRDVLPKINAQLTASEVEFERQAKIEENQEKIKKKEEIEKIQRELLEKKDQEYEETQDGNGRIVRKKKENKKLSWVAALTFAFLAYYFLFDNDAPKKVGPITVNIVFPITKPVEDRKEASKNLSEARALYDQATYLKRRAAGILFLKSAENQFSDNPALGELVRTNSELLENAKSEKEAALAIFKLIRILDKNLFKDAAMVEGTALFFGKIKKPNTGILTIKNFLRAGSKPTTKMLGIYLDLLLATGDLVEAKKIFVVLKDIAKKPYEVFLPLAKFQELNDLNAEAIGFIDEGLKYYPKNVALLLKSAEYSLKTQEISKADESLKKIKQLECENSPIYLAQYYKLNGLLLGINGKQKEAAASLKKSLDIREDEDLRMRLAELEIGGEQLTQTLIKESKIITLLKKGKEEIKNKNWNVATSLISEAVEADQKYIPSILTLADLQIARGLYDAAIHTLLMGRESDSNNTQIIEKLTLAYLAAFKLDDAQKLLIEAGQTKFRDTKEFSYLYGLFFENKGNIKLSFKYYEEAYKANPLDDKILFKIATLLFNQKQMINSKKQLSEALFLDPRNTEYLSLYAQILNDQDGPDVAIGYLRDLMSDIGEDPKLLSTITAIYFRSGQLKEFKMYYSKVQQLPKKDEGFYEFLIAASKLDQSMDDFEKYSKELIDVNPGKLKVRMDLAVYYLEKNRMKDAMDQLEEIKTKLPSYPNVHYLLAKLYLAQDDIKQAKKMAEMELKLNPTIDTAHFIMGEVHRNAKEYREAITYFEKAISLNPKSFEALMSFGWIRLNQNLGSEALDLYTRAIKLDPNNAEVHKQLGFTYKSMGQRAMAKEKFEDYLKISPGASDRPQIESLLKQLR